MNLIMLQLLDFVSREVDETGTVKGIIQFLDQRRCEHILTTLKSQVGDQLQVGEADGRLGRGTITEMTPLPKEEQPKPKKNQANKAGYVVRGVAPRPSLGGVSAGRALSRPTPPAAYATDVCVSLSPRYPLPRAAPPASGLLLGPKRKKTPRGRLDDYSAARWCACACACVRAHVCVCARARVCCRRTVSS